MRIVLRITPSYFICSFIGREFILLFHYMRTGYSWKSKVIGILNFQMFFQDFRKNRVQSKTVEFLSIWAFLLLLFILTILQPYEL